MMKHKTNTFPRDHGLDKHRGFAIIIMVIFHLAYDLNLFGYLKINFQEGFWFWFPRFIAGNFLFCVGISLQKAYSNGIIWSKFWKRFSKIFLAALAISTLTYFLFPKAWVYFGTLHCIALSSLLGLVFVNRAMLTLTVAAIIGGMLWLTPYDIQYIANLFNQPSMDFIPLYPWFAIVLLGIFYEIKLKHYFDLNMLWKSAPQHWEYLGKKSLVVYLFHQPLLFGIIYLIYKLTH